MNIRPAKNSESGLILGITMAYAMNHYPRMKADVERTKIAIAEAISSSRHFAYVAEKDGRVVGVLIALTNANLWAQKSSCHVVAWISKKPGAGAQLLREFAKWVESRPAIKVAGFYPDTDEFDARAGALAERIGFKRHSGAYLLYN